MTIFSNDTVLDGDKLISPWTIEPIGGNQDRSAADFGFPGSQRCVQMPAQTLISGGEACPPQMIEILRQCRYRGNLYNHYGPTETTIGKLIYKVNLDVDYTNIPIGSPFSNTKVFITDHRFNLSPIGVAGELFIGGTGVARGYLQPDRGADVRAVY